MPQNKDSFTVVVVGGGGAGIAAAIGAARGGARTLILEKMPKLGKKVRISGNGRCNIYNDTIDASGYNAEAKGIVESVFARFGKNEIVRFFKDLGLRVYSDETGRVFPITNQSSSVMDLLELELSRLGVELRYGAGVTALKRGDKGFIVEYASGAVTAAKVILCAGGKSFPIYGTDGSAYALAMAFGHHLVEPAPSTVPLIVNDPWCKHLTGQRIKAAVRWRVKEEIGPRREGDLLFADYGLSGLTILDSSEEISIALTRHKTTDVGVIIDLLPFIHEDELKKELSRRMKRQFPTDKLLAGLLPPKFSFVLAEVLNTRNPAAIVEAVKNKTFTVSGTRGWNDAEFTAGGIDHREIDASTLESKLQPGLYLCGEILDIDGKRGGFNLAWAWASGYIAGQATGKR